MFRQYISNRIGSTAILAALSAMPLEAAAQPALAEEECAFQRAYSVDGGTVNRQGDSLIIEVWGSAPGDGWKNAKLAVEPDDTNAVSVAYRLVGCAPVKEAAGGLHPIRARAVLITMPGRIRTILIQAATNDLRLHEDAP